MKVTRVTVHCAKCGIAFKWPLKDYEELITITVNEDGTYTDMHKGNTVACRCKCKTITISQKVIEKILSVKV